MSLTSQEHRAALERFGELLSQQAYQTRLRAAGDGVPYDTLLVRLESFEEANRVWLLELSFLPGLESDLERVSILQSFVSLADQIAEAHGMALNRLLVRLNAKLPLGGFGLLDNPGQLFYKHNALLPDDYPDAGDQIVRELVPMTAYLITLFSEPLIRVASGQKSAEEALSDMPFAEVIR
ncbi:MAG TPA: hypothetical protein VJ464_15485 [Blastocatellia bacterium]|nr:hypothetical protein [Blastocatellia bacterium]